MTSNSDLNPTLSAGAWVVMDGKETKLYGSKRFSGPRPEGTEVTIDGCDRPGVICSHGLVTTGSDGKMVRLLSAEVRVFVCWVGFVQGRPGRCCGYKAPLLLRMLLAEKEQVR